MSKEALDKFGKIIVEQVWDRAINDWEMIVDGRMKSQHAQDVRQTLSSLDADQIDAIRKLIPDVINTAMHHFLWTLEQADGIDVAVRTDGEAVPSIKEVSDGLAGELPGWISRFSSKPYRP